LRIISTFIAVAATAFTLAASADARSVNDPGPTSAWNCIHRYEGSWSDSGAPYWGGLQMDVGFMKTYGLDFIRRYHGYADRWPPVVQMIAANRARIGVDWLGRTWPGPRGFGPWPTRRFCGL
jgi:hypothetical protein